MNAQQRGIALAALAAGSGALLLFIPLAMLGYSISVVVSVVRGETLAWHSVVAMSYAMGGPPALLSAVLLVVPYRLLQAAASRISRREATVWVGGLLVVWHAGVATIWARGASGDGLWYPFAFGLAAVAILLATVAAANRSPAGRQAGPV